MNEHEANGKTEEEKLQAQIAILKEQKAEAYQVVSELEKELAQAKDRFQDLLDAVRSVLDMAEVEPGEPVFHYAKGR